MMIRVLAVACCLLLIACGGGGLKLESLPQAEQNPADTRVESPLTEQPVQVSDPGIDDPVASANKLVLSVPDISGLAVGSEFEVSLAGSFNSEVYQGSMRLLYDAASLRPIKAERGSMLLSDMVHLASLDQDGFVPFAFTGLPGHNALAPGSGELLRVRFRVMKPEARLQRIMLQNDQEFLQLRDRNSRRIQFDLESRAGVQQ